MTDRRAVATDAAEHGAAVAFNHFETELSQRAKSGKVDIVTEADEAAQAAVIESIREAFPGEPVVGEEGDQRKTLPERGPAWVVDPIDGTNNFVHGIRRWGTAVTFVRDTEPEISVIEVPTLDETYVADRHSVWLNGEPIAANERADPDAFVVDINLRYSSGLRGEYTTLMERVIHEFDQFQRIGSTQFSLALLARGSGDVAVGLGTANPWDTVAGVHMVRQAGGTVTDVDGERWRHDSDSILATNGAAHDAVVQRLFGTL